jgi:5-(carboxyamino)imidazole ribonucleotide synthase
MTARQPRIAPGKTLGILGGGQLGRMTAMAAREMGYRVRVLDPDPDCSARPVVEELVVASFDDVDAARALASRVDVVTFEIEKLGLDAVRAAAELVPVRPGADVLAIIQDRIAQKSWLERAGFPVGPSRAVHSAEELGDALVALGAKCFAKAARGGYDGRGQFETQALSDAEGAFARLGSGPCLVEAALPIERELSVLVARNPSGQCVAYPPAENHHESRILAWSALPARVSPELASKADELARGIASELRLEGILCVELFVVDGTLLVNELAPRPHNSYHTSFVGSATSQFEQHVRAVCDLPLGSVETLRPAAIANLLGELWEHGDPPFERALAVEGVRVHLYGKASARPGRKMGHISATASSADEAVRAVVAAKAALQ